MNLLRLLTAYGNAMLSRSLLGIFLIFLSVPTVVGQTIHGFKRPIGSLADITNGTFSSSSAGFSIELPKQTGGFDGTRGMLFSWRLTEGYYFVGIEDREVKIEGSSSFQSAINETINNLFNDISRDLFATKHELLSAERRDFEYGGHKAVEIRATLTDTVAIVRVFWAGGRAYKMGVVLSQEQSNFEPKAVAVFNTLQIITKEATDSTAQKLIEANTPKALPQSPVIAKVRSDAEDEGIKVKVKLVIQESQFTKGKKAGSPKQRDSEAYYNEQGNLVKRVSYDDTSGFPFEVTVYGYIARNRVSKSSYIEFENDPPGIAMMDEPTSSKRRDSRYDHRYSYKYDTAKNLVEESTFDNSGVLWTRQVFKRRSGTVEELLFDEEGQLNTRSLSKLDGNGLEVETTVFDSPVEGWNQIFTYKYDEFDKEGNWIHRTVAKSRSADGSVVEEWVAIETRSITYF